MISQKQQPGQELVGLFFCAIAKPYVLWRPPSHHSWKTSSIGSSGHSEDRLVQVVSSVVIFPLITKLQAAGLAASLVSLAILSLNGQIFEIF